MGMRLELTNSVVSALESTDLIRMKMPAILGVLSR